MLLAGTAMANPYAPYEGETVVVMFPAHPHYDAAIEVLDDFTEQTGIEVEVDQLQYLRMRERQTLELTKDEGDYDLISYVVFSKADYVYADQLENLAKYFMNPALADPSYDQSDLIEGYVQNIGVAGGEKGYLPGQLGSAFGVPFGSETSVLAYRKDIFDKHGLEAFPRPTTSFWKWPARSPSWSRAWAAWRRARRPATRPATPSCCIWRRLGGRVFDENWEPIVNNEAGVEAANALKTIVDCGPEGGTTFGPSEAAAAFKQGDAAMFMDSIAFAAGFEDPERIHRRGQRGLCAASRWACARVADRRLRSGHPKNAPEQGSGLPADAVADLQEGRPRRGDGRRQPVALLDLRECGAERESSPTRPPSARRCEFADPDWRPIIPTWGQINADIGTTMSQVLTEGLDPQEALDGVAERARAIMEEAGYYAWQDSASDRPARP